MVAAATAAAAAAAATAAATGAAETCANKHKQTDKAPAETPVEPNDAEHGVTQRGRTLAPGHERDGGAKPRSASRSLHGAPRVDNDGTDDLG